MKIIRNILFSIGVVVLFFGICEALLRLVQFKYSNMPLEMVLLTREKVEGIVGWNNQDGVIRFKKDPIQLWVPVHSFEEKVSQKKPAGTTRIATLGDSCTQGCVDAERPYEFHPYPQMLEEILNTKISDRKMEVLNASVGSYSSFQGFKRLEHVVLKYHPDLLTIYFGWNDHWITAQEDKNSCMISDETVAIFNVMERFRFFQFLNYLIAKLRKGTLSDIPQDEVTVRVALEDYAENLNRMIDLAQTRNIRVLLITAPSNLRNWKPTVFFPYPRELLESVHRNYNDAVRQVAQSHGVSLLDLEQFIHEQPQEKIFSQDGIHLTPEGCRFVAEAIAQKVLQDKLLPS